MKQKTTWKQPEQHHLRFVALLLFIFALFMLHMCNPAHAQTDSIQMQRIMNIERVLDDQQNNIEKFDKHFRIGQQLFLTGAMFSAGGWCVPNNSQNRSMKIGMVLTGVCLDIAGIIVLFDSEKYLKRNTRIKLTPCGVTILIK